MIPLCCGISDTKFYLVHSTVTLNAAFVLLCYHTHAVQYITIWLNGYLLFVVLPDTIFILFVHSIEQKSIGLIFRTSRSGSYVRYICHHNLSLLLSPYLCIRGISLSSIHYNQSHRVYMNRRQQYICLIWN